jgi:hypothetical protein
MTLHPLWLLLVSLPLVSGCSVTRAVLGLGPDPQAQPVAFCPEGVEEQLKGRIVTPKQATGLGQELHLRLGVEVCPAQRIEVCRYPYILTSGIPQVEFVAYRSTEKQACPEHTTEDTRVFRVDSVKLNAIRNCWLMGGSQTLCFIPRG